MLILFALPLFGSARLHPSLVPGTALDTAQTWDPLSVDVVSTLRLSSFTSVSTARSYCLFCQLTAVTHSSIRLICTVRAQKTKGRTMTSLFLLGVFFRGSSHQSTDRLVNHSAPLCRPDVPRTTTGWLSLCCVQLIILPPQQHEAVVCTVR